MMSIELFLLINIAADYIALFIAAMWLDDGRVNHKRAALASIIGAIYAAFAFGVAPMPLLTPPVYLVVALGMVSLAIGRKKAAAMVKATVFMLAASFVIGGATHALINGARSIAPIAALVVGMAISLAVAWFLARNKRAARWNYGKLNVRFGDRQLTLDGAVDSGNRAIDPISGLPVVIIPFEKAVLTFPELSTSETGIMEGMRLIPLSTISGKSLAPCFTPDILLWNGSPKRAVIAVANRGSISLALAPSCFEETSDIRRSA